MPTDLKVRFERITNRHLSTYQLVRGPVWELISFLDRGVSSSHSQGSVWTTSCQMQSSISVRCECFGVKD